MYVAQGQCLHVKVGPCVTISRSVSTGQGHNLHNNFNIDRSIVVFATILTACNNCALVDEFRLIT